MAIIQILNCLFFQSLMASHDIVAQRDYLPKLQEITFDDFDDEEETVKMVQLVKTQDPTVRVHSCI